MQIATVCGLPHHLEGTPSECLGERPTPFREDEQVCDEDSSIFPGEIIDLPWYDSNTTDNSEKIEILSHIAIRTVRNMIADMYSAR